MLLFVYNLLQTILLFLSWPLLLALVLAKPKYRRRFLARLGFSETLRQSTGGEQATTIWIHALSVGEITSAVPLVRELRAQLPDSTLYFSAGTESGEKVANDLLQGYVDQIVSSPLDIYPTVHRYLSRIKPDIFILVETDFWPNLLLMLQQRGIPTILVNGRISKKSLRNYRKFALFFRPIFESFDVLSMQTKADADNLVDLGIPEEKLRHLGNLKLDYLPDSVVTRDQSFSKLLPPGKAIITAGSTHRGEEELIFTAYVELRKSIQDIYLALAPRNPERAEEVLKIGEEFGLKGQPRTEEPFQGTDYLLLDTIGELIELYSHSYVAFVGGSLVPEGGHNPVEPANLGVPVIFGPHMEDFSELATSLIECGGGKEVTNERELVSHLTELLSSTDNAQSIGQQAKSCFHAQRGVIGAHLKLIRSLL